MIYFIGFIVGILNGLFAAGAGQILVVYFIFSKKIKSHLARAVSISLLASASIFTAIGYSRFIEFDIIKIVIILFVSLIAGYIGAKLMKKIKSNILNLISGIIVTVLSIIRLFS
ncbi:MAG: sulfite exporter TauE/SafE family protein [Clostridia bacterium]|nr:sulfite exporter TauE/SafE family protein [Clostridia bacterium]